MAHPVVSGITDEGSRANSELIASWRLSLHGLQPSSGKFYLEEVSRFEGWLAAHDRPDTAPGDLLAVTRRDIEAWLSDLRTAGLSDATLRSRWVALRSLYRWLVEEDELEVSPLAKVMVAKGEAPPISVLEDDQLRLLRKACEGKDFYARRDLAMIRLFLATGLRKSELAAIAVEDLDLAARIVVGHPKGGKRTRVARFDPATASAIDRYKRIRARHRLAAHPILFLGRSGQLSPNGPGIIVDNRARRAGIGHVHPHQLRHTFAHRFLSAGGNDGDLQKLGGWANAEVMRRYGASRAVDRALAAYDTISPMGNL